MSRPLTLPRIAATEAQALGRLARHVLELHVASWADLHSPSPAPRLSLRHLGFGPSPLNPEDAVRSRVEWSGCRLALDVPRAAAQEWTQAVMGGAPTVDLPGPWRTYALERALHWVVDSLSACGKGTARLTETGLMASGPVEGTRHRFILSLEFSEPAVVIHAVLHCDNLGLLMLAGLVPVDHSSPEDLARRSQLGGVQGTQVPVRLHITLGCTDLNVRQLRELASGDVVFIVHPFFDGPHALALRVQVPSGPTWRLMVQREGQTLTVSSEALAMTDSATQPDDDETDHSHISQTLPADDESELIVPLGNLKVRLSFDVGHQDISFDELSRLQPGEVLRLDRPVGDIVTLRANGAVVGKGTLVEVDGRVGVMLTELAAGRREP